MLWFAVAIALVAALGVAAGRYIRQLEDGEWVGRFAICSGSISGRRRSGHYGAALSV